MRITGRYNKTLWIATMIVMIFSGILAVQAQEKKKKFSKKDVPAAVLSAFEKTYPKAKITGADKENEKGTTYYEIESTDGTMKRDLLYTADGKVYEIEETITAAALPGEIKTALDKEYAKAKIVKAEKVMRGSTVEYELLIKNGKITKEITFDSTGKILKGDNSKGGKEDDDEDDDDDNE
jgi:hypothetical protein